MVFGIGHDHKNRIFNNYYDYDYQEYYDAPANEEEDPALAGNGTTTANKPSKTLQEVRNRVSSLSTWNI